MQQMLRLRYQLRFTARLRRARTIVRSVSLRLRPKYVCIWTMLAKVMLVSPWTANTTALLEPDAGSGSKCSPLHHREGPATCSSNSSCVTKNSKSHLMPHWQCQERTPLLLYAVPFCLERPSWFSNTWVLTLVHSVHYALGFWQLLVQCLGAS